MNGCPTTNGLTHKQVCSRAIYRTFKGQKRAMNGCPTTNGLTHKQVCSRAIYRTFKGQKRAMNCPTTNGLTHKQVCSRAIYRTFKGQKRAMNGFHTTNGLTHKQVRSRAIYRTFKGQKRAMNCPTTNGLTHKQVRSSAIYRTLSKINMYNYRKQTPEQQTETLRQRRISSLPLHEPPHFHLAKGWFLITAATYEHKRYFHTDEEQAWLLGELQKELQIVKVRMSSWVVLPNHYHLLVQCHPLSVISRPLRKVHARTARELNRRDKLTGRKIWHLFSDRQIRNERPYYTTLNYIHYNPTKHDYVRKPSDWTCSSVHWYEKHFGIEWLRDLWRTYPIRDYGKGWDWLSQ